MTFVLFFGSFSGPILLMLDLMLLFYSDILNFAVVHGIRTANLKVLKSKFIIVPSLFNYGHSTWWKALELDTEVIVLYLELCFSFRRKTCRCNLSSEVQNGWLELVF